MTRAGDTRGGRPLRLLVLAYYFPPAGGAGVQRVLKWVKYLPEHGVEPTILTVGEGAYPELDETLGAEVPPAVRVVRTAALDPFGVYARLTGQPRRAAVSAHTDELGPADAPLKRLACWVRANVLVPDARAGWVPFALARGLGLCRDADAILSTGPPHSTHLAARALQRRSGRPWVADFRDPWTDVHYYDALPRARPIAALDAWLERGVLRQATAVLTVSPSWASLLAQRSGREVEVIYNGFDPADFQDLGHREAGGAFVLAHVGSLFEARNPVALWDAIARLRQKGDLEGLRIRIVGRVGRAVLRSAAEAGLDLERTGYVSHAEAVREMAGASLLLLATEPQRAEAGHIPGKLFEYMASGTPVLGLGDPEGDAAAMLRQTGAGQMFARDDVEGVATHLAEVHARWRAGIRPAPVDPARLSPFSRRHQAGQLAALLRELLVPSHP